MAKYNKKDEKEYKPKYDPTNAKEFIKEFDSNSLNAMSLSGKSLDDRVDDLISQANLKKKEPKFLKDRYGLNEERKINTILEIASSHNTQKRIARSTVISAENKLRKNK
tara:strand:- start:146 stop:472 length:327 start_codon:yes stop_codon:yes gene_type:complete